MRLVFFVGMADHQEGSQVYIATAPSLVSLIHYLPLKLDSLPRLRYTCHDP